MMKTKMSTLRVLTLRMRQSVTQVNDCKIIIWLTKWRNCNDRDRPWPFMVCPYHYIGTPNPWHYIIGMPNLTGREGDNVNEPFCVGKGGGERAKGGVRKGRREGTCARARERDNTKWQNDNVLLNLGHLPSLKGVTKFYACSYLY